MNTNRQQLEDALDGRPVTPPVFAVYDWFVKNRPLDWPRLFDLGLGQVNHAYVTEFHRPNVQIIETSTRVPSGQTRRDVRWITDIGELHEWYLDEWRQEYLIKQPDDYRIMARAFADATVVPLPGVFEAAEAGVGANGMTFACPALHRTAFQAIQIDFAGLERFALDLAGETPELYELMELLDDLLLRDLALLAQMPGRHVKLWENLSIETIGPHVYRRYLTPTYHRILDVLRPYGRPLHMHYDGKLRLIANDIARLDFHGLDSLTPPPEGDVSVAEARSLWPDKFFWLHPPLGWYRLDREKLQTNIQTMIAAAGPRRFCLMISEDVPANWQDTIPFVLGIIRNELRGV